LHHDGYDAGVYGDTETAQPVFTQSSESAGKAKTLVRILDFEVPDQDQIAVAHLLPSRSL